MRSTPTGHGLVSPGLHPWQVATLGHVFDSENNFMLSSSLVSQQIVQAAVRKRRVHVTSVYTAASQISKVALLLIETNRQYLVQR